MLICEQCNEPIVDSPSQRVCMVPINVFATDPDEKVKYLHHGECCRAWDLREDTPNRPLDFKTLPEDDYASGDNSVQVSDQDNAAGCC